MTFDLEAARRNLIAKIGHSCSNLIEQLENLANATGEQKKNLHKAIRRSIKELNE